MFINVIFVAIGISVTMAPSAVSFRRVPRNGTPRAKVKKEGLRWDTKLEQ